MNYKFAFYLLIVLLFSFSSCKEKEDENPLSEFLGTYEMDITCYNITPGGTFEQNFTTLFFVELPDENSGLGDNYLIFKNFAYGDDFNFIINGKFFILDTPNETPVAEGYLENGNLIFTHYSKGFPCDLPITAIRK